MSHYVTPGRVRGRVVFNQLVGQEANSYVDYVGQLTVAKVTL